MREKKLDEHARQVRGHMARLESKAYWTQFDDAPEFVVMFLPGEAFLYAACQRDPDLLEYGFEKHVLAVSPTNLISLLKTVHHAWQHQAITESAQRVRALGAELYDRLRTMTERLVDLGTHLDRAVRSYDQLGPYFERRVLVSARKFREMGAAGSREIPRFKRSDIAFGSLRRHQRVSRKNSKRAA